MTTQEKAKNGNGNGDVHDDPRHPIGGTKSPTFEVVLKYVGEFGPFQIRLFSILTLMDLGTGQCMMFFVFANANPGWECRYHGYGNVSSADNVTSSENWTTGGCGLLGEECDHVNFSGKFSSIVSEVSRSGFKNVDHGLGPAGPHEQHPSLRWAKKSKWCQRRHL
jgi:hypothetical protein